MTGMGMLLCLVRLDVLADTHEDQALQRLEAMSCGADTLGARLEDISHTHSRRDLGWRFFPEGDALVLERAFRVSKSMDVKYRWQLDHDFHIKPISEAAQSLCQP